MISVFYSSEEKTRLGFVLVSLFSSATSLLLLPLYMIYLDASEYGIWTLIWLVANLAGAVSNLKLDHAMRVMYFEKTAQDSEHHKMLSTLLMASFIISGISTGLFLLLGSGFYDALFSSQEIAFNPIGAMALLSVLLNQSTAAYYALLQNEKSLKQFASLKLSIRGFSMVAQIFIISRTELGIFGLVCAELTASCINQVWVMWQCRRYWSSPFSFCIFKKALIFSTPLMLFGFLFLAERKVDRLLIEHFMSLKNVGIYAVLGVLGSIVFLFYNAMDGGFRADLYTLLRQIENGQQEKKLALTHLFRSYQLSGLVVLSGLMSIACFISVMPLAQSYGDISQYLVFFVLALLPIPVVRWQGLVLLYEKKSTSLVLLTAIKLVAHLLLLAAVLPMLEIWGAIVALAVSNALNVFMYQFLTGRDNRHLHLVPALLPFYVALVLLAVLIFGMSEEKWLFVIGAMQLIMFFSVSVVFDRVKRAVNPQL